MKLPQLVSTVALDGPFRVLLGGESWTSFGAGAATSLQPAGSWAPVEVSPSPPPQPAITSRPRVAASAVRPVVKAQKATRALR